MAFLNTNLFSRRQEISCAITKAVITDAVTGTPRKTLKSCLRPKRTINDINAQTEIIQQQDRTLELRLKQLDTEQNALNTELEAVKKVIETNVEATFKTFA